MLQFTASNPYPLLNKKSLVETELKRHSRAADKWLGLRTELIEVELAARGCRLPASNSCGEHQELWFGLDIQNLLTPYALIRYFLHLVSPEKTQKIIDLGAAYGRMAFVIARHYPEVHFVGYEYVGERVLEGRRVLTQRGLSNVRLEHVDLASSEFVPEPADIYFIYDYGKLKSVEKTIYDLKKISKNRAIQIVARGKRCPALIKERHPWLRCLIEFDRVAVFGTEWYVEPSQLRTRFDLSNQELT